MAQISLSCRPGKEGDKLIFPYTVENPSGVDVYVMDAMPTVDAATRAAAVNPRVVTVIHGPGTDATTGRFIAPLPTDRRVAMPVIPLARRLPHGGTFEGRVELALPLAETSPYFADLTLRQYEVVTITGVVFTIGFWVAGEDGLAALPCDYAPDLFTVVTRNTVRSARRVSQRFQVRALQLFRRTDAFPRTLADGAEVAMKEGELLASRITAPA
jgi:hypothetical protein